MWAFDHETFVKIVFFIYLYRSFFFNSPETNHTSVVHQLWGKYKTLIPAIIAYMVRKPAPSIAYNTDKLLAVF